jgi:hypothetical protein
MSAKWVRSQRWDDQHLTGALWPVKVLLRLFSWISTAVVLLSLVAIFGILASVPIGLLAKIPYVLLDGLSFVAVIALVGVLPLWLITRFMRSQGVSRTARVVIGIPGLIILCVAAGYLWWWGLWPLLRYDPATGSGFRLFGAFIDRYQAVQVRRLPGMEMSELEFYAWWPLRVVLMLFVINLVVATIRRIEFTFPRIGVLTVHSGIVTIALGSIYYTTHKQEGDMILLASEDTDAKGNPLPGRAESGFYDNTRVALWVTSEPRMGWEERQLRDVPRYNDYNLDVLPRGEDVKAGDDESFPALNVHVPDGAPAAPGRPALLDDDIKFRIVGYASYCTLDGSWVAADKLGGSSAAMEPTRLRSLELVLSQALPNGTMPRQVWQLAPDRPADRIDTQLIDVEYTIGMSDSRWEAITSALPAGAEQAILVEYPASGFKAVYAIQPEKSIAVGETGYTLQVRSLMARPPMPIVTKGYQGAESSLAIIRVTPPKDAGGSGGKPALAYDRWVYSRFPEISQDMVDGAGESTQSAMPKRRDADPALRITYIDASSLQEIFDERPDGSVRAVVRTPGGAPTVKEGLKVGDQIQIAPVASLKLGERIEKAVQVEAPRVVPESEREREKIGKHDESAIALEIRDKSGKAAVHWVPYSQYCDVESRPRRVTLGDGRIVHVMFGRQRHEFWPQMMVRLKDFDMIPYPNSTTPKDYKSEVIVTPHWGDPTAAPTSEVRQTSLNNPLLIVTPYVAPDGMPALGRVLGRLMSIIAPNQYKFAQAGWDQAGWRQSEQMVAAGRLQRPQARFTILGVGNNPGIYIIAAGAVMMSIGIPWAFYLKPWLMKREKRKIQARLASESGGGGHSNGTISSGEAKRPERVGAET